MIEIADTTKGLHGEITVTSEKDIWYLHDELPPFGTKCEYIIGKGKLGFKSCYFVGLSSSGNVVIETGNGELKCYQKWQINFRPLKSEREKFVEEAVQALKNAGWDRITKITTDALNHLYNAGFRAPE